MNLRAVHIRSIEYKGGIYSIFQNEWNCNYFVKLEDGNRRVNEISNHRKPYRLSGAFNNEAKCIDRIERFAS